MTISFRFVPILLLFGSLVHAQDPSFPQSELELIRPFSSAAAGTAVRTKVSVLYGGNLAVQITMADVELEPAGDSGQFPTRKTGVWSGSFFLTPNYSSGDLEVLSTWRSSRLANVHSKTDLSNLEQLPLLPHVKWRNYSFHVACPQVSLVSENDQAELDQYLRKLSQELLVIDDTTSCYELLVHRLSGSNLGPR